MVSEHIPKPDFDPNGLPAEISELNNLLESTSHDDLKKEYRKLVSENDAQKYLIELTKKEWKAADDEMKRMDYSRYLAEENYKSV